MKTYISPEMEIYRAETLDTFMLEASDGEGNSLMGGGGNTSDLGGGPIQGGAKAREMEEAIESLW